MLKKWFDFAFIGNGASANGSRRSGSENHGLGLMEMDREGELPSKRPPPLEAAPPKIAAQIYTQAITTKMVAKCTQGGESIDKAIAWAASELQGFMRT